MSKISLIFVYASRRRWRSSSARTDRGRFLKNLLPTNANSNLRLIGSTAFRMTYLGNYFFSQYIGSVDNSSSRGLRPAACPRDPGILNNSKPCSTKIKRTGSCGQAAGRRHLKCQHTLIPRSLLPVHL